MMFINKTLAFSTLIAAVMALLSVVHSGCAYGFSEKGQIADSIKTVRVNFIENRAPYVNPQLSPTLTDRLRQKINNQTKLSQTNNDNAHLDIRGTITDYSYTTVGVSTTNGRSQTSTNRLTVTVQVTITNQLNMQEPPKEFSVSRSFDFDARQTIQQVEAQLLDEMVRNLTDEIFNRLFSDW